MKRHEFLVRSGGAGTTCALVLAVLVLPARADPPGSPDAWVDRAGFPEAYGILTSDHLLFPDNVSDWPLEIDCRRQLFIDDYLVASCKNVTRRFHQPVKHPANPLLTGAMPAAVLRDAASGKFRMWYNLEYAESRDGITWTRPDLGPHGNKVFDGKGEVRGFIVDPEAADASRRYRAIIERRPDRATGEKGGFYLFHSADGLHWTQDPAVPSSRGPVMR